MSKLPVISLEKLLLGGCLIVIFIVFPGAMLFWNSHPEVERQVGHAERSSLSPDENQQAELPENAGPPPIPAGTKAVSFVSTTVNGKSYAFNSQSSDIKIVEFWATWCGPCHMSIPTLEDLDKSFKNSGVEVVGVSVDTDTASQVLPFTKAMGVAYTVLVNPQQNLLAAQAYNATTALPSIYIIDGKGIIRWSFSGYWPDEEPYIRQIISEIRAGQAVDQP